MQKQLYVSLIIALSLMLCACTGPYTEDGYTDPISKETQDTLVSTENVTITTEVTETTVPAHSALYLPQYSAEQIITYFEEIALDMEYTDGTGDASLIQKWNGPMYYRITGNPTDTDLAILEDFFDQLNAIPGFPGIHPAEEGVLSNLNIGFMNPTDFKLAFSGFLQGEDAYGATQFWYYTATNEIHTANIGYRTDIDQATRSSVLLEEIVNMLGLSDTVLRQDSIVYQYSNTNTALSDVDWVILKLLYDPAIQCGMDAQHCREILAELYY